MKRGLAGLQEAAIDYGDIQSRIDVQAVLDHYGADNQREETNRDGTTEIIHSCLIDRVEPHHANGDANPSCAANLQKKLYICHVYWSGSMIDLIAKMERKDHPHEVVDTVSQFLDGTTKETDAFRDELEKWMAPHTGLGRSHLPAYSERILHPWAFTHPYVVERGIDLDTASRLQVGYDQKINRITIPHFWRGSLVGWQARAIPGREGQWPATDPDFPKYKNSPGFPKADTLYRFDDIADRTSVVVVESPFSVIRAASLDSDLPVVATFGAKVSDHQLRLLRDFKEVIIWMDDDPAGRTAEKRMVRDLHRRTLVRVVESDEGMDLGDYDDVELVKAKIDAAIPSAFKLWEYTKEELEWVRRNRLSGRSTMAPKLRTTPTDARS